MGSAHVAYCMRAKELVKMKLITIAIKTEHASGWTLILTRLQVTWKADHNCCRSYSRLLTQRVKELEGGTKYQWSHHLAVTLQVLL